MRKQLEKEWVAEVQKRGNNMPSVRKGESQSSYMSRCVPAVKAEGKKQNQAIAQCINMFKQKWTESKRKRKK